MPSGTIPENYFSVEIEILKNSMLEVAVAKLQEDWAEFLYPASTRQIREDFIRKGSTTWF